MNRQLLLTNILNNQTLRNQTWGENIARILVAALEAVDPAVAVRRHLRREGDQLIVGNDPLNSRTYNLSHYEHVFIVGAGKAGTPMCRAAVKVLRERLTGGIVIVRDEPESVQIDKCTILTAGHPIPDQRGIAATQEITDLLDSAGERDLVLVLISGGASALLTKPAANINLSELQLLTNRLLACGANIKEINTVRKHVDLVKGGGLAKSAYPATVITLILSDVVGNPLDVIASGPTVADSTTFAEACAVLERYNLIDVDEGSNASVDSQGVPQSVRERLRAGQRGEIEENPGVGDPCFERVQNLIVGSNLQAAKAALAAARNEGFTNSLLLTTSAQGEARVLGRFLAAIAREIVETQHPVSRPACIIVGGETTVTLCESPGKGGRNQELALAAVCDLAGLDNVALVTLATDGSDGPEHDAAGAVVTGETLKRVLEHDVNIALANNDAYTFFNALDDLLRTEPTETNVNDLAFVFVM